MNIVAELLRPWPVVVGVLFDQATDKNDIDCDGFISIFMECGVDFDQTLSRDESYSNKTRLRVIRQRVCAVLSGLDDKSKLCIASKLARIIIRKYPQFTSILSQKLQEIGWKISADSIMPDDECEIERLFLKGSNYDAQQEISSILSNAKQSICIIDNFMDGKTINVLNSIIKVPTILITQSTININDSKPGISIVNNRDYHDRFIIIDKTQAWHLGASIKDAGKKAFMINKIQDERIIAVLVDEIEKSIKLSCS